MDTVFSYLMQGGVQNFQNLFLFLSDTYFGTGHGHEAPAPLPWEGIYHPDAADGMDVNAFVSHSFQPGRPSIGILFYRAHWMSGNLLPIDALIRSLESKGANVLPVYAFSLKHSPEGDGVANRAFTEYLAGPDGKPRVQCIVNTMGMSMGELSNEGPSIATGWSVDYLDNLNVPMVQAIVSTGTEDDWLESDLGLGPIDTAMSVALPEFDGQAHLGANLLQGRSSHSSLSLRGRVRVGASPALRSSGRPRGAGGPSRHQAGQAGDEAQLGEENRRHPQQLPDQGTPASATPCGLDTPNSAVLVLNALKDAGYQVSGHSRKPATSWSTASSSGAATTATPSPMSSSVLAAGHVTARQYADWFATFPDDITEELSRDWGEPPGQVYRTNGSLAIAGH